MRQLLGKVFLVGAALNFPWEMVQAYLYAPMGDWGTATARCLGAALVDAVIVLGIAVAGSGVFGSHDWFRRPGPAGALFSVAAGASVAVLVERLALSAGRWHYGPLMPIIPAIEVGAIPVLQMMILPLVVFRYATRRADG